MTEDDLGIEKPLKKKKIGRVFDQLRPGVDIRRVKVPIKEALFNILDLVDLRFKRGEDQQNAILSVEDEQVKGEGIKQEVNAKISMEIDGQERHATIRVRHFLPLGGWKPWPKELEVFFGDKGEESYRFMFSEEGNRLAHVYYKSPNENEKRVGNLKLIEKDLESWQNIRLDIEKQEDQLASRSSMWDG